MDILSAIVKQVEAIKADESCLCRIRYFLEDFYSVYMRENEKSIEDYKKKIRNICIAYYALVPTTSV